MINLINAFLLGFLLGSLAMLMLIRSAQKQEGNKVEQGRGAPLDVDDTDLELFDY